jgi:hypothetical protein
MALLKTYLLSERFPTSVGLLYAVLPSPLSLYAYLSVLRVWSDELEPGLMHAIITILELYGFKNESLSTIVSLLALKGTCELFESRALMHSLRASKLLLISAPSKRRVRLLLYVSAALSEPARSTNKSFPIVVLALLRILIMQIACERDEVSLAAVQCVVRSLWPKSMISIMCLALLASLYSRPVI